MSHTYNVHIIHHRSKNKETAAKWGLKVWGAFHANKHHIALCAAGWVVVELIPLRWCLTRNSQ